MGLWPCYCYELGKSFSYTYYASYSLSAGQSVVFETRKADPCSSDPVMYLFNVNEPASGSWSNDDYNCYQSRIAVQIPVTGTYKLLVRAFNSPGTTDLYKDGQLLSSNIALGGTLGGCGIKRGQLNYFTSNLTGDSILWLVDGVSPGRIQADPRAPPIST